MGRSSIFIPSCSSQAPGFSCWEVWAILCSSVSIKWSCAFISLPVACGSFLQGEKGCAGFSSPAGPGAAGPGPLWTSSQLLRKLRKGHAALPPLPLCLPHFLSLLPPPPASFHISPLSVWPQPHNSTIAFSRYPQVPPWCQSRSSSPLLTSTSQGALFHRLPRHSLLLVL